MMGQFLAILYASFATAAATPAISSWTEGNETVCHTQIWSIAADTSDEDRVFCASNDGLCIYDGQHWEYCLTGGNNIIRNLKFDKASGRLYSAGVNGYGYWTGDGYGSFEYTPLFSNPDYKSVSIDFWRIGLNGTKVYFQSRDLIMVYDRKDGFTDTLRCKNSFRFLFEASGNIYCQDGTELVRFLPDGGRESVCSIDDRAVALLPHPRGLLAALEHSGLYIISRDGKLEKMNPRSGQVLSEGKLTSMSELPEGGYVAGTSKAGIYILDGNCNILKQISLNRNPVLCISLDRSGNIWTGLNNGVAETDRASKDRYILSESLGQVHCLSLFGDRHLLAGSNKGVFIIGEDSSVKEIPGLSGPAWGISEISGKLYIMHDNGVYLLSGNAYPRQISSLRGTYNLCSIPANPDVYIGGTASGLDIYRVGESGILKFEGSVKGFSGFARNMAVDGNSDIWIGVNEDGFICLHLSEDYSTVLSEKYFRTTTEREQLFITVLDGQTVLCCGGKAYSTRNAGTDLMEFPEYSKLVAMCGSDARSIRQDGDRFWFTGNHGAGFVERSGSSFKLHTGLLEKCSGSRTSDFILINGLAYLGFRNGIGINIGQPQARRPLHILSARAVGAKDSRRYRLGDREFTVPYYMNSIEINAGPLPANRQLEYRISSLSDEWTRITADDCIRISSLQDGRHEIQMRIPGTGSICSFEVRVLRPWYRSIPALIAYLLLMIAVVKAIVDYSQRRSRQKQDQMQKELDYLQMQNELLEKERKLATHAILGFKADETIEKYFDAIYDGFTDRLKSRYPTLSKTDLKILIFIKMNLSSKEMAIRMNISPKGVEIAKYRLRKKLSLTKGESLSEFVAGFRY